MRTILFLIIGVVILVGLFFFLKPKPQSEIQQSTTQVTSQISPTVTEGPKKFSLTIEDKQIVSGPKTITVTEGEDVVIKVRAQEEEELHLHGYDVFVDLVPGEEEELSFTASIAGRFIFELEHSQIEIAALEVMPK